jgi:hypothetical protein
MMPAFVVPEVQTTATTSVTSGSRASAASTDARVSRWSSVSTVSASISSRRRVLTIEECASVLTTTRGRRPARVAPSRCFAVSRATASAERLPADPPETKVPPAPRGSPASSAISRSTEFSAAIAPDASSHEIPWMEAQETTMSKSRLAFVGAAGMNPRNRGLSAEMTLGAITEE